MEPERHRSRAETDYEPSADLCRSTDPLLKQPVGYFGWGIPRLDSAERADAYLGENPDPEALRHLREAIETYAGQGDVEKASELSAVLQRHAEQYTEPHEPPEKT